MNKAPAFQFYVADYMQDTRCLSLAAKGAWTDCLCAMWRSQTKGEITYPLIGFARLFGCTVEQAESVINELVEMQICDRVTHGDGKVTLTNRRMKREAKEREQANNRQKSYRDRQKQKSDTACNGKSDGEVTTYSSSSSSSSPSAGRKADPEKPPAKPPAKPPPNESQDEYLIRKQLEFPKLDIQEVFRRYLKFCREKHKPPKRRFFDEWLETEDEPLTAPFESDDKPPPSLISQCDECDHYGMIEITVDGVIRRAKCKHPKLKKNGG